MKKIYSFLLMAAMLLIGGNAWAQNVAKIGSTEYATLSDAFSAATDGCTITLLQDATLAGATSLGSKSVTITAVATTVKMNIGNALTQMPSASVTFENMTVENKSNTNYRGFQTSNLTFNDCALNGEIWTYANNFVCNGCTFTQKKADSGNRYSLYVYGSKKVELNNCAFSVDGKAVKIAKDGDASPVVVIANGCTFISSLVNKNAFMYDTRYSQITVIVNNSNFNENFTSPGCEGGAGVCWNEYVETATNAGYGAVGTDLVLDEDNNIVSGTITETTGEVSEIVSETSELVNNGDNTYTVVAAPAGPDFAVNEIEIATAADLVALANHVNAGNNMAGKLVKMTATIDMTGVAFTPIGKDGAKFSGTFDGQENQIQNLTVNSTANYVGLFGSVFGGTIKNLYVSFPNITNNGENYTGAIVGGGYAMIDNCYVTGGSVTGVDQVGAVIGYLSCGYVKNCTVDGTTVTANGDRAGGITGKANVDSNYDVVNNVVKNAAIVAANKVGEMRSAAALVGQVMASDANHWAITDNTIISVSTKTADDVTFVPVGEFRSGCYQADAVTAGHIVRNHWEPATEPDSYTMVNPADASQFVTINNFYPVAKIGTTGYESLAAAFAAVPTNNTLTTIELLADCAGCGIVVSAGQNVIVNFNNHTYTVNQAPLAGSAGTKNQCFQLLKGATVVFNNGKIVADAADVKMIIQNYADLTLNNMVLDATVGTNNVKYVLSTNNGETNINNTTITAKEGAVAFDVCGGWGGYESNAVTVSGTSVISGKIEISQYNETATETLTLLGGNFTNAVIVVDQANGGEQVTVTKAADAEVTAPEGYKWENNTLVPDLTTVRTGLASGLLAGLCEKKQIVRVEGATLYDIEYFDGFYVHFVEHQGAVVAGQPVIYQADGGDIKVQLVGEDAAEAGDNNGLHGTFNAMTAGSLTGYYAMVNNQVRLLGDGATMGAGKAYIVLGEITTEQPVNAPVSARRLVVGAERVTTGMEMNEEASAATKMVINGELYIIRGSQMFNAAGQMQK